MNKTNRRKERRGGLICGFCNFSFYLRPSAIKKGRGKYCCRECYAFAQKGKKLSSEHGKKVSEGLRRYNKTISVHYNTGKVPWNKGRPSAVYGESHPQWKGGITPQVMKIRNSLRYKQWVKDVFSRDNYTCLLCGKGGGNLEAHHIKSFSGYPELRFELFNGATLCWECHELTKSKERNWEWHINSCLFSFGGIYA